MKTKQFIFSILLSILSFPAISQLKVDNAGRIGMGTNYPNPGYKCHIQGNLLVTNYPANPYYEINMKVGNGSPGAEIGASAGTLAFWSSAWGWNNLQGGTYYKMSDRRIKSDIVNIDGGLKKVMSIKPVYYSINTPTINSEGKEYLRTKKEFGFIAQDIKELFPEVSITDTAKGIMLLDYDQIIPVAISAIQEQQKIIENLEGEIEVLKQLVSTNGVNAIQPINNETRSKNILFQNNPNPFDQKTTISYSIEDGSQDASILIFDMNGTFIKKIIIPVTNKGAVEISASELKAGMYIYTLIVNQKEVDSKRMILMD